MKYNPKLSEFLEKKKDITVIGLYWAGFWRLQLCIFIGYLVLVLIILVID